jgi:2-keto-4-pentenoate hydratase/2-oxohepta-3-ene-1,7-dioic acid hydratase in catechol pathway
MSRTVFALGTFSTGGCEPFGGLVLNERVVALRAVSRWLSEQGAELGRADSVLDVLKEWERNVALLQGAADTLAGERAPSLAACAAPVGSLALHAPVHRPAQIFCSGANYKKHVVQIIIAQTMDETKSMTAEERRVFGQKKMDERAASGTPYFFLKAPSSVTGPVDPIVIPSDVTQADWELELGVVIGKRARRVKREQALDYVAGYTIVNDLTSRERVNRRAGDLREMGMNWVGSKSSPTYLPMGPWLVPAAFVPDPQNLRITLRLNGQTMQDESTEDMIFGVARLIEDLSAYVELQPGDLICTGSPAGNGMHYGRFLRPGDVVEGTITHLGTQRNVCIAEGAT